MPVIDRSLGEEQRRNPIPNKPAHSTCKQREIYQSPACTYNQREIYQSPACIYKADSIEPVPPTRTSLHQCISPTILSNDPIAANTPPTRSNRWLTAKRPRIRASATAVHTNDHAIAVSPL